MPMPLPGDPRDSGRVTNRCLGHNPVWFASGCKKDMPKECKCLKYGHYCGVYVWVLPGGEDELTKLTLAILDYAVNLPATVPVLTKSVIYYIGADGSPVEKGHEVGTVSATIPIDSPSKSVLAADHPPGAAEIVSRIVGSMAARQMLLGEHMRLVTEKGIFHEDTKDLEERTHNLKEQIESQRNELSQLKRADVLIPVQPPTLPAPYVPSIDVIGGPGLIQLQNRLQSVQPVVPFLTPPPG